MTLTKLQFLKGFLNLRTIKISQFKSSAACGKGIPELNQTIIVFLCNDEEEGGYKLNYYVPFSGWVENTKENVKLIRKRLCQRKNRKGVGKCRNRDTQWRVIGSAN